MIGFMIRRTPEWIEDHEHEIELEPLYAAPASGNTQEAVSSTDGPDDMHWGNAAAPYVESMPSTPKPLIRKVETPEGFNIVIGERWAAHFPKESESQIDLLIEKIGVVTHTDETKP